MEGARLGERSGLGGISYEIPLSVSLCSMQILLCACGGGAGRGYLWGGAWGFSPRVLLGQGISCLSPTNVSSMQIFYVHVGGGVRRGGCFRLGGFSYEILLSCLSSSMQIYYYVWALGGERRSGPEIYFSGGMGIFPLFLLGFS